MRPTPPVAEGEWASWRGRNGGDPSRTAGDCDSGPARRSPEGPRSPRADCPQMSEGRRPSPKSPRADCPQTSEGRRPSPTADSRQPNADCRLPTTDYRPPTTDHRKPKTENRKPSPECRPFSLISRNPHPPLPRNANPTQPNSFVAGRPAREGERIRNEPRNT